MKDDKVIYETLEYTEEEKGVGILSLNRPQKYNAVNLKMLEELEISGSCKKTTSIRMSYY